MRKRRINGSCTHTLLRIFICVTMVFGTFFALCLFPTLLEIAVLSGGLLALTALISGMGLVILILVFKAKQMMET